MAAELISHTKYMRSIYQYIPNIIGCITPDGPALRFSPSLSNVALSTFWAEFINMHMFYHSLHKSFIFSQEHLACPHCKGRMFHQKSTEINKENE